MIDLRNRLIHGYFDIDLNIVWDTIANDIPPLIGDLKKIFSSEDNLPREAVEPT